MRYSCDTCGKSYNHKRNLKRLIKDRHSQSEHWNCLVDECKGTFIRREYLSRHLVWKHSYSQPGAREAAINASRGDCPVQHGNLKDVSEDDSILDLLDEREVNVHGFCEKINDFDTDTFDQVLADTVNANELDISLDCDVDIELVESVVDVGMFGDGDIQACNDFDNKNFGDKCSGAAGFDDDKTESVNGASNDGYDVDRAEDEISFDNEVDKNVSVHDDESVIVISSDDDDMGDGDVVLSEDRTVAVSNSTTVIHAFV